MDIEKIMRSVERIQAEARAIKAEIMKESTPKPVPGFDDFWNLYPLHVKQQDSEISWAINVKEEDVPKILKALRKKQWGDRRFIPSPDRWLAGKRWRDEDGAYENGKYAGLSESFQKPKQ